MSKFNLNILVRENIKNLQAYSSARDEFKDASLDMVFIDANENPYNSGLNRYPDSQQTKVKEALAKLKKVSTSQILLGNGSDEVLDLIFRAFCEPKTDNVIQLPPTYGMYKVLANINDTELVSVNLTEEFQPNVDAILNTQNDNSKVLFLCSPNNPTANSFDAKKIEKLITDFNGIVVIDEAYIDFSEQESWISKLNNYPNLMVTQTLSKAYGLAGIRLGICYASEEIIKVLNKIKPPYNVNKLTQFEALTAIQNQEKVISEVSELVAERTLLEAALQDIKIIEKVYTSDANFVLAKVKNATKIYQELLEKGIVVRNRSNQVLCDNCLRFSVGTPSENKKLINTLNTL